MNLPFHCMTRVRSDKFLSRPYLRFYSLRLNVIPSDMLTNRSNGDKLYSSLKKNFFRVLDIPVIVKIRSQKKRKY